MRKLILLGMILFALSSFAQKVERDFFKEKKHLINKSLLKVGLMKATSNL